MPNRQTRMSRILAAWLAPLALAGGCSPKAATSLAPLPSPRLSVAAPAFKISPPAPAPKPRQSRKASEWDCANPRPWKYIVIHHSATAVGSAAAFDRNHRARGFDELGYHFVIDNGRGGGDGLVEVGSRWRLQKWGAHCGGTPGNEYNNYGIGICLVGDFSDTMPSAAQLASLHRLVVYLMDTYKIPPENVIGHRDAPKARTACPGGKFHAYLVSSFRPRLSSLASAAR